MATTLKRYQAILNIGLKKSEQQVRPTDRDIRYIDAKHIVMVDVLHNANNGIEKVLAFEGKTECTRYPKTPEEIGDPATIHISRDYLKAIIDGIAPGTTIKMTVGTDYPLRIDGLLDAETACRAWIAPRIENE